MATFEELKTAIGSTELQDRCAMALRIVADKVVRDEDTGGGFKMGNHANRLTWAKAFLFNVENGPLEALAHMHLVVASKRDDTIANILAISDADMQTTVEEGIDLFAGQASPGP